MIISIIILIIIIKMIVISSSSKSPPWSSWSWWWSSWIWPWYQWQCQWSHQFWQRPSRRPLGRTQTACHSTWIGKMMTMNVNVITMSVNLMVDVTMIFNETACQSAWKWWQWIWIRVNMMTMRVMTMTVNLTSKVMMIFWAWYLGGNPKLLVVVICDDYDDDKDMRKKVSEDLLILWLWACSDISLKLVNLVKLVAIVNQVNPIANGGHMMWLW